jgi:hypothetical protein
MRFKLQTMQWVRGHKFYGTHVVCAVLLSALAFSYLYPFHEYVGNSTGSVTMGYDICDDSPCLLFKAGYQGLMPVVFFHFPKTESAIPESFIHSIFHPPRA